MAETHNDLGGTVSGSVVQAGHIGQLRMGPVQPEALAGLPPDPPGFTGRETDLRQLLQSLGPGPFANVTAMAGLAGVGKTTLAVRAAHEAMDRGWFPGGVLFADLRGHDAAGPVRSAEVLAAFVQAMGVLSDQIPAEPVQRAALYRSLLYARPPMLIVLDNASAAEEIRSLLPGSPQHRVLVTSRRTLADLAGTRQLELDVLTEAESVDLLAAALETARLDDLRISEDAEAAAELARLCGYLPLALGIVAALLISDPGQPPAELAEALRDASTRLGELSYGDSLAVHAAFDLSYVRLNDGEARLFRLLSVHPGHQVSVPAATALAGLPERETRKLLDTLRRAHMVIQGERRGWFRFHDLLRLYAAEKLDARDRGEAVLRLLDHYLETATAAADLLRPKAFRSEGMHRFPGFPEALAWLNSERSGLIGAVSLGYEHECYEESHGLAVVLSDYFDLRKDLDDWLGTLRVALVAARRLADRRAECDVLIRLGRACGARSEFDTALRHYERASVLTRELEDRYAEALTLNHISAIHRQLGELERALSACVEALEIQRELGNPYGEAEALNNLASIHRRVNNPGEAVTHDLEALRLRKEMGDRRGEAQSLNNIGNDRRGLLDPDAAIENYLAALEIHEELGDTFGEAQTRFNIGLTNVAFPRPGTETRSHWEAALAGFTACGNEREARMVRAQLDWLVRAQAWDRPPQQYQGGEPSAPPAVTPG